MTHTMLNLLDNINRLNNRVREAISDKRMPAEDMDSLLAVQFEFINKLDTQLKLASLLVCIATEKDEEPEEREQAREEVLAMIGAL